jgi:hypothetical protein
VLRDTPPGENDALSGGPESATPEGVDWVGLARAAYDASTTWLNASRRKGWGDSLRMFQGQHATGSKYLNNDYRYRSRLFRPKSRATIRKTEAATAEAFFSNENVCAITAENEDDPQQMASARLMKELLNIRLTQQIPWFLILNGARQDCEVYGICVSRQYWRYEEKMIGIKRQASVDEFGNAVTDDQGLAREDEFQYMQVVSDHPDIALIAPDNFHFDPACDWARPVDTSPYLIERMPMFVGDIKEKMRSGEWKTYDDGTIVSSKSEGDDATRLQREGQRQPSMDSQPATAKTRDFDIAWVHLNTVRHQGTDYVFFTLGANRLLTDPKSHVEVYGREKRPYRIGFANLEAHRNYPSSKMEMLRDLQSQANDTANLRLDALKLSLQPRPKVKSGTVAAGNLADFRVFMPGKPILVNNMDDVDWDRPPDISQSAYLEQDRVNADFDEIGGTFNQGSVSTNRQLNETVGGMELLEGAAGTVGSYELRLFVETWVRGVIEDLVDLEQRLEDDETILSLAGARAQLVQRYGVDEITDWMLSQRLTTKVNVGTGATNPTTRISNFVQISTVLKNIFGDSLVAGLKFDEVCSEIFGSFGYADGKRFFIEGFDPVAAMKAMQTPPVGVDPNKMQEVQIQAQTDLQKTEMQTASAERIAAMKNAPPGVTFDPVKLHIEQFKADNALRVAGLSATSDQRVAAIRLRQEEIAQAEETRRAVLQHQAEIKGHVIKTLPAAAAKLLVARNETASAERIARMRPHA